MTHCNRTDCPCGATCECGSTCTCPAPHATQCACGGSGVNCTCGENCTCGQTHATVCSCGGTGVGCTCGASCASPQPPSKKRSRKPAQSKEKGTLKPKKIQKNRSKNSHSLVGMAKMFTEDSADITGGVALDPLANALSGGKITTQRQRTPTSKAKEAKRLAAIKKNTDGNPLNSLFGGAATGASSLLDVTGLSKPVKQVESLAGNVMNPIGGVAHLAAKGVGNDGFDPNQVQEDRVFGTGTTLSKLPFANQGLGLINSGLDIAGRHKATIGKAAGTAFKLGASAVGTKVGAIVGAGVAGGASALAGGAGAGGAGAVGGSVVPVIGNVVAGVAGGVGGAVAGGGGGGVAGASTGAYVGNLVGSTIGGAGASVIETEVTDALGRADGSTPGGSLIQIPKSPEELASMGVNRVVTHAPGVVTGAIEGAASSGTGVGNWGDMALSVGSVAGEVALTEGAFQGGSALKAVDKNVKRVRTKRQGENTKNAVTKKRKRTTSS